MKTNKAFTLIELLVVIAIISILATILFPVFAQVRDKARSSACMSNMKQLGMAMGQYTSDYDERMFPHSGGYGTSWWKLFLVYTKSNMIFVCPSDTGPSNSADAQNTVGAGCSSASDTVNTNAKNGINAGCGTIPRSVMACSIADRLLLSQVAQPATLIVINEKWGTDVPSSSSDIVNWMGASPGNPSWYEPWAGDGGFSPIYPTKTFKVANRHNGLFNCVFLDGHAKAMQPNVILNDPDLSTCNQLYLTNGSNMVDYYQGVYTSSASINGPNAPVNPCLKWVGTLYPAQ